MGSDGDFLINDGTSFALPVMLCILCQRPTLIHEEICIADALLLYKTQGKNYQFLHTGNIWCCKALNCHKTDYFCSRFVAVDALYETKVLS